MRGWLVVVALAGCGRKARGVPIPDAAPAPRPTPDANPTPCPEPHAMAIALVAGEDAKAPAGPVAVVDSVGYRKAGDVHVVLATYDTAVGSFMFAPPRRPEELAVELRFTAGGVPGPYPVKHGSAEPRLVVSLWPGAPAPSGFEIHRATGGATVTFAAPDRLCGSIDLVSEAGTTIRGTFNVAVEKDL